MQAAAVALFAAACSKENTPADTTAAASTSAPTAVVQIVSPAEGDSTGPDVTVVLSKQGVTIEKASGTKADGVGHYHLFLDTAAVDDGVLIPPTSKNTVHIGTGDSTYTFTGLTPGAHQLIAVIGYGDHSAMPEKRDTVHFVVKK
jgi:hypothetical protein